MAAHRHWRIYQHVMNGGTATSYAEVEMRIAPGGADQCTGGTPSASHAPSAGVPANAFANDGTTTSLTIASTGETWLAYDFGAGNEKDIVEVAITGTSPTNRSPAYFRVDWSDDGVDWTTEWKVGPVTTGWATNVARVFTKPTIASDTARYWRVDARGFPKGATSGQWRCAEFQMFDTIGGANVATGGTPMGSHAGTSGLGMAFAFDGDFTIASYYNNAGFGPKTWIGYDFWAGNDKAIKEVLFKAVGGTSDGLWDTPNTGDVDASNDGISWVTIWSFANRPCGLEYIHIVTKPGHVPDPAVPGTHRFWGLKFNATQTPASPVYVERLIMASAPAGGNINEATTQCFATAKINATGYYPYFSIQNSASDWQGRAANGGGEILGVDHLRGSEVIAPVEIRLLADAAAFAQMPTDFDLVYSDDGDEWFTQENFVTPATWVASETRTFGVTPPSLGNAGAQIMIGN
jgi:hypothetical protein